MRKTAAGSNRHYEPRHRTSKQIIADYEQGCIWAAIALDVMFLVLSLGCVFLGW